MKPSNRFFGIFLGLLGFILSPNLAQAQENSSCLLDLKALYAHLQETPSYKDQVKGDFKTEYEKAYQTLQANALNAQNDSQCFLAISGLVTPLRDNHLYLSQVPKTPISSENLKDSAFVQAYRQKDEFLNFSNVTTNMDSLETALSKLSKEDPEGIYWYGDYLKVGLFQTIPSQFIAVVFESKLGTWAPGQIAFLARKLPDGNWNIWNYNIVQKNLGLYRGEQLVNGTFARINYSKTPGEPDFSQIPAEEEKFQFKHLTPKTDYLRLGTFATSNDQLEISQQFHEQIKDSLLSENLIVDLRNNGGGGFKASRIFYQLLREYAEKGNIWVLLNQRTVSNAEQFTIELLKRDHVTSAGIRTAGILTYGNNYGKTETLPSGKFQLYITDMKDSGNYLPYESVGISPQVSLAFDRDWIQQVLEQLEK